MNINLSPVKPFFQIAGMVIVTIATLKLFGFAMPFRSGDSLNMAAVAAALLYAGR